MKFFISSNFDPTEACILFPSEIQRFESIVYTTLFVKNSILRIFESTYLILRWGQK